MKQRAEKKGFTFAYLFDPSQQIARDYGATVHAARVLARPRAEDRLHGRDRRRDERRCRQAAHLQDAIDAVLAGKEPAVAKTKQVGCGIKL